MVGNEVVIRKACEADFEFILEANAAVSEKGSNTVLKDTERLKKDLFGKTARAAVIIAEVEGQAVGMALYATTYFANEGELMWVSQMYVEPRFRNRKQWIAPALMSELIKIAQEKGWAYICWATDIGNNISGKNRFYCELTAQYWIWKNCRSNYVGLFHYRRFLNFKTKEKVFHTFGDNFAEKFGLTEAGVLALCRNYDVILPRKCPKGVSLYENYNNEHIAADLDAAVEIIGEKYPAMAETAEEVLRKSNEGYFMNILVTSKTFFDRYSAWLFDVLGELERRIQDDVVRRSDYQKRVYGFVAERLMNVYIEFLRKTENIKIKELPLLFWEEDEKEWRKYKNKMLKRKILTALGLGKKKWKVQDA